MVSKFLAWAEERNWNIKKRQGQFTLPDAISQRYKIPDEWLAFIKQFSLFANEAQTKWFITFEDAHPGSGFRWNEFELISLESASSDAAWTETIKNFWDKHLPIFMSVEGEYEYCALNVETGQVMQGWEPEFEEAGVIADSLDDFFDKVITGEIAL